eukprot:CAMPEP_0204338526 /NCGR_PEP_ID=MMETSP0469-20131031/21123_1 /ASSEMBLY_ACC=CAM_ASM_000384 /TAXON_ID=2969 /ORGANISM="Oxyrrhis marina" /LENGTH=116 /DNA_ID=CAMNT_0051322715 /DNA_START=21 /DNA_END=367 /DNA_ORIENTATION=-
MGRKSVNKPQKAVQAEERAAAAVEAQKQASKLDSSGLEFCGDFQAGRCSRGDRCRFSHAMPQQQSGPQHRGPVPGPIPPAYPQGGGYDDTPVCNDFRAGRCNRDRCKFAHTMGDGG